MIKKIVLGFFLGFLVLGNVSFIYGDDVDGYQDVYLDGDKETKPAAQKNPETESTESAESAKGATTNKQTEAPKTDDGCTMKDGIKLCNKCLIEGQCAFSVSQFLGIRKSIEDESLNTSGYTVSANATVFVQDIILSATFFIGTVVTIAIIISGISYVMAGASGKDPSKAKSGLIYSIIGLILVVSSYAIIRLVQYIAKGF